MNKGIEFIDLHSIFKDESVISSVPNDFNNSETSIICYKYNTPEVVKIPLIYKPLQGMRLWVMEMLFLTLEFAILILKIFFFNFNANNLPGQG